MQKTELRDIVASAVALAIAFAVAFNGGITNIEKFSLNTVIIAFVAVSLSFILHELAHRFLARRYGCYAEYKMWPHGLMLALFFSLFGFVFAAPGAVMIHPKADLWGASQALTKKRMGLIALVGPLTNVALAGLFFAALMIAPAAQAIPAQAAEGSSLLGGLLLSEMFALAVSINVWLALFNMIPIAILDGAKVFYWNKKVWAITFIVMIAMFAATWIL
mgnify:CR=1 FL=1